MPITWNLIELFIRETKNMYNYAMKMQKMEINPRLAILDECTNEKFEYLKGYFGALIVDENLTFYYQNIRPKYISTSKIVKHYTKRHKILDTDVEVFETKNSRYEFITDNLNLFFETKEVVKKKIKNYITAISALNIPYKGVQPDWHQIEMLQNNNYSIHPLNFIGAVEIFKEYGIYDNTSFFTKYGYNVENVLVATPIRAVLDILFYFIYIKNIYPKHFMLKDFDFSDVNKEELNSKLKEMLVYFYNNENAKINLERWMDENKTELVIV